MPGPGPDVEQRRVTEVLELLLDLGRDRPAPAVALVELVDARVAEHRVVEAPEARRLAAGAAPSSRTGTPCSSGKVAAAALCTAAARLRP